MGGFLEGVSSKGTFCYVRFVAKLMVFSSENLE
jgi:hypothetical protein